MEGSTSDQRSTLVPNITFINRLRHFTSTKYPVLARNYIDCILSAIELDKSTPPVSFYKSFCEKCRTSFSLPHNCTVRITSTGRKILSSRKRNKKSSKYPKSVSHLQKVISVRCLECRNVSKYPIEIGTLRPEKQPLEIVSKPASNFNNFESKNVNLSTIKNKRKFLYDLLETTKKRRDDSFTSLG